MKIAKITRYKVVIILFIAFLSGCATQLAPKYDTSMFEGVTSINIVIMELFASVSTGTEGAAFSEREDTYNAIIGAVDALALQSKARPMPQNSTTEKVNKFLESKGVGAMTDDMAPSANSLEAVSKLISMKETDRKSGLTVDAVKAFKNAVIISMDQAITYESFLER